MFDYFYNTMESGTNVYCFRGPPDLICTVFDSRPKLYDSDGPISNVLITTLTLSLDIDAVFYLSYVLL